MKINREKRIGRVLFVVEGSRTEFVLLRRIFCDILGYSYLEKRRNRPDFFVSAQDSFFSAIRASKAIRSPTLSIRPTCFTSRLVQTARLILASTPRYR